MRHSGANVSWVPTSSPPLSHVPLGPSMSVNNVRCKLRQGISAALCEDKPGEGAVDVLVREVNGELEHGSVHVSFITSTRGEQEEQEIRCASMCCVWS